MTKVTNRADGARGFNVPTEAGGFRAVLLQPGESVDIDLEAAAQHTLAGWVASGDLVLDEGDPAKVAEDMAAEADALAAKQVAAAEADKATAEKRRTASEAIAADATVAGEAADAEQRAARAGDPPPVRRGKAPAPPAA